MFTDEDFLSYITEMDEMERNMCAIYIDVDNNVSDAGVKDILRKLIVEETDHVNNVGRLRKLAVKKIVDG